jgi:hypothetical protein
MVIVVDVVLRVFDCRRYCTGRHQYGGKTCAGERPYHRSQFTCAHTVLQRFTHFTGHTHDSALCRSGYHQPPATFALSGPTLRPVEISPTPRIITIGEQVVVIDVGVQQLNVRDEPGVIDTAIIFRAEEGSIFTIIDGPRQADGLTWWQIQDPYNTSRTGWAASNYLQIAPQ